MTKEFERDDLRQSDQLVGVPADRVPMVEVALLRQQLSESEAEVQRLQVTLNAIFASRSWRLTAPLRAFAKVRRQSAVEKMIDSYVKGQSRHRNVFVRSVEQMAVPKTPKSVGVCAIVHIFYMDLLPEMVEHLTRISKLRRVIVTHPVEVSSDLLRSELVRLQSRNVILDLFPVENRGRDFLPFLQVLPVAMETDCEIFLKIHTKKSPHLPPKEGEMWRKRLLEGLLPSGNRTDDLVDAIAEMPSFGFAAPEASVAGRESWGRNRRTVKRIVKPLGLRPDRNVVFPAGSMFWFGRSLASALVSLKLSNVDFEEERGQLDGTMAHALERAVFSLVQGRQVWIIRSS